MKRKWGAFGIMLSWWTRLVFVLLTFWAFMLYVQHEWIMIEWPW